MKKKLIFASLAALALVPSTAMAQSGAELRRDRQEVRDERRDVRDARQDLREEKRDLREARWDYGREVRDYNRANPWKANFRYERFRPGARIRPVYYSRNYVIVDYGRFHWARPGVNERWVRHYDDALLVNVRTGRVIKVVNNAFRWR
jgi:Ni/Co efflux regulator RcnB